VSAYGALAEYYDELTRDVDYESLANHYESLITRDGRRPEIILDLACGTGRLTRILAERGYQMIGVDASEEMLAKAGAEESNILYLHQSLEILDLYGTVDAAICSLDGLNYLPPTALDLAFRRIFLFLNPGAVFAFDLNTAEKLESQNGEFFCDEREDLLCIWRASFDEQERACYYDFDFFTQTEDDLWERQSETHVEYAYTKTEIQAKLEAAGFTNIQITDGMEEGRIFIAATCPPNKE